MKSYQFMVLRYRYSASLGELMNIGLVIFSLEDRKVAFELTSRSSRLAKAYPGINGSFFRTSMTRLRSVWKSVIDKLNSDQQHLFDDRERILEDLRCSLLPPGENTLVWSETMVGIDLEPLELARELFDEYVGKWERGSQPRPRVDDKALRESVQKRLASNKELYKQIYSREIAGKHRKYAFDFCWKNGKTQVLEPISLDYESPESIVEKAERWTGRLSLLDEDFQMISILAEPSSCSSEISEAYRKAKAILESHPKVRMAIPEMEMERAEQAIKQDLHLV